MARKIDVNKILNPKLPADELVLRGELLADYMSASDEGNAPAAALALSILMARVNNSRMKKENQMEIGNSLSIVDFSWFFTNEALLKLCPGIYTLDDQRRKDLERCFQFEGVPPTNTELEGGVDSACLLLEGFQKECGLPDDTVILLKAMPPWAVVALTHRLMSKGWRVALPYRRADREIIGIIEVTHDIEKPESTLHTIIDLEKIRYGVNHARIGLTEYDDAIKRFHECIHKDQAAAARCLQAHSEIPWWGLVYLTNKVNNLKGFSKGDLMEFRRALSTFNDAVDLAFGE